MIIEYLGSYKAYTERKELFKRSVPEGIVLEEIEELENILNKEDPLPKVFKEYLWLGGERNGLGFNIGFKNYKGNSKFYQKKMKERGIEIRRPFIIFDSLDGATFAFIYLDEGDNPQPWNCSVDEAYDSDEGEQIYKMISKSFSQYIEKRVNYEIALRS